MNNETTPSFKNISLDMRLTRDDNGQSLLRIEHLGYFVVPASVMERLQVMLHYWPEAQWEENSVRFVVMAMLNEAEAK